MSSNVTILPYNGKRPVFDDTVFLADGVRLLGEVTIGRDSSIWYNSVIRGDVNYITIGAGTNIQDLSMLHVTGALEVGDQVTVGHKVTLHACVVESRTLIGMGAIVLDGAVVEENSIVAAGAVVTPGTRVPSGSLFAGVPARQIRELTEEELDSFVPSAERYIRYARKHRTLG